VMKMSLQNQPEHTEQWNMNSKWTAQNGTRYKLSNKWETRRWPETATPERNGSTTTQPGCIFYPPTEGGLDTTLQVRLSWSAWFVVHLNVGYSAYSVIEERLFTYLLSWLRLWYLHVRLFRIYRLRHIA
jgi:hypothetical protein